MNKSFIILPIIICSTAISHAQTWLASTLPEQLKKNAHSVVREQNISFDIKSPGKAYYKVHEVVTVLDDGGKKDLYFFHSFDKFHSLEDAEITVFDEAGKKINKFSKKQFYTQNTGEGLVSDGKIYYYEAAAGGYPLTIQYDYTIKYSGMISYPNYEIQEAGRAIEHSTYSVTVPSALDIRYKQLNTTLTPVITTDGKDKVYKWEVNNQPSMPFEEGSVSGESYCPQILLAPNKFEIDDYEGDMTSWKNFGNFYGSLCSKTINLSPERKLFFQAMVKDAGSDREKIKLIYRYLQENFRYVLINLGIGGLRPLDAEFTDKKKYGDCKGLSNYTQACLAAVGIKSYQALINAEYNKLPVDPSFPYNGFNHVIVCVPMTTDSVWLECTSNTSDFGVLGNFTENRNALLITEEGGKLVPTPKSLASSNIFSMVSTIKVEADGSAAAGISLATSGEYREDVVHRLADEKKDEQKKYLVFHHHFLDPGDLEVKIDKQHPDVPATFNMSFARVYDFKAGSKFFLHPRLYKIWGSALPTAADRKSDFYFGSPFIKTDTTIYQLPEGYTIETLPQPKKLEFKYGYFSSSYEFDESKRTVTSTARFVLNEYRVPAAEYAGVKKFFDAVMSEYNEKIVIRKS